MMSKVDKLKVLGDERGQLIALETNKEIPFTMKRIFYIYGTQANVPRGNHAHYKTKQYLVAVNGRCKVTLDDGKHKETFDLDEPNLGLFQDALVWGTMHDFSDNCVLMIVADTYYDANDYITDYKKFKEVSFAN